MKTLVRKKFAGDSEEDTASVFRIEELSTMKQTASSGSGLCLAPKMFV
jgi:hypothetical protein